MRENARQTTGTDDSWEEKMEREEEKKWESK